MVSMAGSFAAQPQLLIFLMPFDLWLILSRPFTPCMLAIDVRLQKDSIWPWWLDVFFPVEFCDLRLPLSPLAVSIIKNRCMSSTKNAPGQEREHFNEYSCGNCDCDYLWLRVFGQSAFSTLCRRGVSPKPWKLWYLSGFFCNYNIIQ